MHEINKVTTFKSEIYIKVKDRISFEKCKCVCKEYLQKTDLILILTPVIFLNSNDEFTGFIITINNNPIAPEEENILKKHTFSLAYKIRSEVKDTEIYALYKDISFSIKDLEE